MASKTHKPKSKRKSKKPLGSGYRGKSKHPKIRLRMRKIDSAKTRLRLIALMKHILLKENRLEEKKSEDAFEFQDVLEFDPVKSVVHVHDDTKRGSFIKRNLSQLMSGAPSYNLTDPGTIYEFVLTSHHNYSSTAGGIVDYVTDFDPSTIPEYSSIIAMFSMVRLKHVRFEMQRVVATAIPTTVSVGAFRPIMFVLLRDNPGLASSYAAIEDSPNFKNYNYAFETKGMTAELSYPGPSGMMPTWADTSVPASTTTYVGCPGACQVYGESVPATTEVLFGTRTLVIQVMNRI